MKGKVKNMRKDMLLKDWCKKVRYSIDYKIKVQFMFCINDDNGENALYCFADLYRDGRLEATEIIDRIVIEADDIEKIPASMKRKAKSFYEYFKACDAFENTIQYIDKLITL